MESYYNRRMVGVKDYIRYRLREGNRNKLILWAHIYADCDKCNESIGIDLQAGMYQDKISNKEAATIFRVHGWDIDLDSNPKKVLCPICKKEDEDKYHGCSCQS